MDSKEFIKIAKNAVVNYYNDRVEKTDKNSRITDDEVFFAWLCKMLHNNKAVLTTTVSDGIFIFRFV